MYKRNEHRQIRMTSRVLSDQINPLWMLLLVGILTSTSIGDAFGPKSSTRQHYRCPRHVPLSPRYFEQKSWYKCPHHPLSIWTPSSKRKLYEDDYEREFGWQTGNVYRDLERLEQAINFTNADQDRLHKDRLEVLDEIAAQRRPLDLDIVRLFLLPTAAAFLLSTFWKTFCLRQGPFQGFVSLVKVSSSIHFWIMVVGSPLAMLLSPVLARIANFFRLRKTHCTTSSVETKEQIPPELQDLDPEYFRFVTITDDAAGWTLEEPLTSVQDHVKCLCEQWTTAVAGMLIFGTLCLSPVSRFFWSPRSLQAWPLVAQILTRLGSAASLRQFPKLYFALTRSKQQRPIAGRICAMQTIVASQWPLALAALDLSLLLAPLSWWSPTKALQSSLAVLGSTLAFRYALYRRQRQEKQSSAPSDKEENSTKQPKSLVSLMKTVGLCLIIFTIQQQQQQQQALSGVSRVVDQLTLLATTKSAKEILAGASFRLTPSQVFSGVGIVTALIGPLIHMASLGAIVQFVHTHGVSLSLPQEDYRQAVAAADSTYPASNTRNSGETDLTRRQRTQWRYRLEWRDPQRVRVVLDTWRERFWYWLFFSGGVDDKLRKEFRNRLKRTSSVKQLGQTVWQRLQKDQEKDPDAVPLDRSEWKKAAMEKLAHKHQQDYDRGSYEDPLGVAVQQTFNIGLGFNFDHMTELEENEIPSTRRLQARAAKSAIRRAQEIFSPESAAQLQQELQGIDDPIARNQRAADLRAEAEREIEFLSKRLVELVPTDLSLDDRRTLRVQQFEMNGSDAFQRVGPNQYVMNSGSSRDESQAVKFLMKSQPKNKTEDDYGIDYTNPSGVVTTDPDSEKGDNAKDVTALENTDKEKDKKAKSSFSG